MYLRIVSLKTQVLSLKIEENCEPVFSNLTNCRFSLVMKLQCVDVGDNKIRKKKKKVKE